MTLILFFSYRARSQGGWGTSDALKAGSGHHTNRSLAVWAAKAGARLELGPHCTALYLAQAYKHGRGRRVLEFAGELARSSVFTLKLSTKLMYVTTLADLDT